MSAGGEIVAILAREGYGLRDDDTSAAPHGFVRLRYGKGHWAPSVRYGRTGQPVEWAWRGPDRKMVELVLPEELFHPGHPEADQ